MAGFEPAANDLSRQHEPVAGFEPATYRLRGDCSATELYWLFCRDSTPELHRLMLILFYRYFVTELHRL